jgi:hypothetical protein
VRTKAQIRLFEEQEAVEEQMNAIIAQSIWLTKQVLIK